MSDRSRRADPAPAPPSPWSSEANAPDAPPLRWEARAHAFRDSNSDEQNPPSRPLDDEAEQRGHEHDGVGRDADDSSDLPAHRGGRWIPAGLLAVLAASTLVWLWPSGADDGTADDETVVADSDTGPGADADSDSDDAAPNTSDGSVLPGTTPPSA